MGSHRPPFFIHLYSYPFLLQSCGMVTNKTFFFAKIRISQDIFLLSMLTFFCSIKMTQFSESIYCKKNVCPPHPIKNRVNLNWRGIRDTTYKLGRWISPPPPLPLFNSRLSWKLNKFCDETSKPFLTLIIKSYTTTNMILFS